MKNAKRVRKPIGNIRMIYGPRQPMASLLSNVIDLKACSIYPKEASKLAAWLTKAAEFLEQEGSK